MRALITGGMGFIGQNLCRRLLDLNYEVFIIDNLLKQVHGNSYNFIYGIDFTCGDVSDEDTWRAFYGMHFNVLIHLAAETGTGQSQYEAAKCCNTNIHSTAIISDIVAGNKIKFDKIILASSRAVYGEAQIDRNIPVASSEDDVKNPISIYGASKLAQEHVLFCGPCRDMTCALRFQNVYGVGQSLNNPYTGIVSIFSKLAKHNKRIIIFEDGQMSRDFIYITDVVDSIMLCIDRDIGGEIYNVGTGIGTKVLEVANIIKEEFQSDSEILFNYLKRSGDIRHNFANIDKIKRMGFNPKISFNDGIKLFVEWVRNIKTINDDAYELSLEESKNYMHST